MQSQIILYQLVTTMAEDYIKFKRQLALDPNGRFIPYIGAKYDSGLGSAGGKNNPRILIIGPRHYCDASYSSRNLLAYMSDDVRVKLIGNPTATFPSDLKIGCTMTTPKDCLRSKHDQCPVYLAKGKTCPLRVECKIRCYGMEEGGFHCKSTRNLRCETLYAIHEYLNRPSIESARLGLTYFDTIAKFIIEEFNYQPSRKDLAKDIWEKVAFMNLIQRYIPLKDTNFDSKTIKKHIIDDDIFFCKKNVINKLKPDFIIMTMPCIEDKLKTILDNEYELHKAYKTRGWFVYKAKNSNSASFKSKWEFLCEDFFKDYKFPATSIALGKELYNLFEVLNNDSLTSGESTKSRAKVIRTKILEIVWTKLKNSKMSPTYMSSIKCLNYNLDLAQGESKMRKWISNAHDRIIKQSKTIHQIRWTQQEISTWLNTNR